jgi:hypothetical protein
MKRELLIDTFVMQLPLIYEPIDKILISGDTRQTYLVEDITTNER